MRFQIAADIAPTMIQKFGMSRISTLWNALKFLSRKLSIFTSILLTHIEYALSEMPGVIKFSGHRTIRFAIGDDRERLRGGLGSV